METQEMGTDNIYEIFGHHKYDIQDQASDPIAFTASSNPDTMYWHQAMKGPAKAEFLKAAQEEVKSHVYNKHFVLEKYSNLPKGTKVFDSGCVFYEAKMVDSNP
jgi:hypothetical protein